MNRLLQQARQTHQRRMSYFYLAPNQQDDPAQRRITVQSSQSQNRLDLNWLKIAVDLYEDDTDDR